MSDNFCPLPWIFQSIRNNGDLRVCCQAHQSSSNGLIRKESGEIYNAGTDDISNFRNAKILKDIRRTMLQGNWHPACIRCKKEKDAKLTSRQEIESKIWKDNYNFQSAMTATEPGGSVEISKTPTLYYDIRFGNLCNLKCRSCGPRDSSAWYEDHTKLWDSNVIEENFGPVEIIKGENDKYTINSNCYNWHDSQKFWDQLEKNMNHALYIHLVGGEPLLIKEQWEFLNKCIDRGYSKNIVLEYNSNITTIPGFAWDIWRQFKILRMGASIDAVEGHNDYIRHPSNWKKIEQNLKKLDEERENFQVWISLTVMAYNIYYLGDIMKYYLIKNYSNIHLFSSKPLFTPHPLHSPKYLCVQVFPREVKEKIKSHLTKKKTELEAMLVETKTEDKIEPLKKNLGDTIDQYIEFMFQEDHSSKFDDFWKNTKKLDQIRGESFEKTFPEFYGILKPYVSKIM